MLAEIIRATHALDLELPGRHNRYHPWVPPHWLPDSILIKLEAELLHIVTRMATVRDHLASSRASSPSSDDSASHDLMEDSRALLAVRKLWNDSVADRA